MIEHLAVSTAVLALAMLAARVLPVTARTRHAMLLCGLAKFAIPSSLLGVHTIKVLPAAPRIFDGTNAAAPATQSPIDWLPIVWAAIATLLFARWLLLRHRTIAAALRSPAPPSPRELDALAAARRLLGIRAAVDLVRSPLCEAPAVLRVVRPVILLPARGCDDLTGDELQSLLLHELAHVARRDNLIATFTSLAGALLWFHPLVWLTLRQLDAAREQACDERVAEAMSGTESYLGALSKVCRAAIALRTAGAACMAGANVKERIEHLMRYETIKRTAWSHRGIVAMAIVAVLATAAIGATPSTGSDLYSLRFTITPRTQDVMFDVAVVENATGHVVIKPRVVASWNQLATITGDHGGRSFDVRMRMPQNGAAELLLAVTAGGETLQRSRYTWQREPVTESEAQFTGAPIDLQLRGAKLKDVMSSFAQITGLDIRVDDDVKDALVTLQVDDMPWDQALDLAAKQAGVRIRIEDKTIHVTK